MGAGCLSIVVRNSLVLCGEYLTLYEHLTPRGIELVVVQLKDTPVKVQFKDAPHIFKNIQGLMEELFQTKEPCHLLGPRV